MRNVWPDLDFLGFGDFVSVPEDNLRRLASTSQPRRDIMVAFSALPLLEIPDDSDWTPCHHPEGRC